MAIHWAYKDPDDAGILEQGDVLRLTPPLTAILRDYHPYYADNPKNQFYLVLTQSCDLFLRENKTKAAYIAIAPVRSLPAIISHEFENRLKVVDGIIYGTSHTNREVEKFLERLFNNNDPFYFYLEPETGAFSEPMAAMLPLAISFKAALNYETLLAARVLSLKDSFQAKLGWLVGQMYSRVGTKDFDAAEISRRTKSRAGSLALWIEESKLSDFEREVAQVRANDPDTPITQAILEKIISELPKRKDKVIQAVLNVAVDLKMLPEGKSKERLNFRRALESSTVLASYF